jgi:hypothetical protein
MIVIWLITIYQPTSYHLPLNLRGLIVIWLITIYHLIFPSYCGKVNQTSPSQSAFSSSNHVPPLHATVTRINALFSHFSHIQQC